MVQYAFIVSAMVPLRTIAIHDPRACVTNLQILRVLCDHPLEVRTSERPLREVTTNVYQARLAAHPGGRRERLAGHLCESQCDTAAWLAILEVDAGDGHPGARRGRSAVSI